MVAVLWRCRCARLCLGGACGAAGVPGGPGCLVCPWAAARPRAVRAASFARRVVSKPGQAPPPPTGTAAWPCGPSGALHAGGAMSLTCGWARRLVVRPGPATAHRHRSQALRALQCPPCGRRLVRINFACNSSADPSNHEFTTLGLQRFWPLLKPLSIELHASFWGSGHIDTCWCRSWTLSARWAGCLKPLLPLLACIRVGLKPLSSLRTPAEPRLKPPSPLRVRNGCFWCSFRVQRCRRF